MQDRFKFRVFISDKKNSKNSLTGMFKVHSLHTGTNKAIITSLYGNCSIKLENNILMQCTGLKDKNGKLIYEGDIVNEMDFVKHIVIWSQEYCRFELKAISDNRLLDDLLDDTTEENRNHRLEVIGNVYQTPELLED